MVAEVSVAAVIPLYNGAPFIRESLESVLRQTEPPDEIFVVDDGSTDEGPAIVEEMAATFPITFLRKQNGGQSSARNLGVSKAKSRYIAFLDQDDIWYDDHLAALKVPFREGKIKDLALVYSNLDQIDRSGRLVSRGCLDQVTTPQPKKSLIDCLRHDMFILPSASLIEKAAFVKVGNFDERLSGYEDDDLFLRMFSHGYRSVYIKKSLSKWRIYIGSTSYGKRMSTSRMIYMRKLVEIFPNEPRMDMYWVRDLIAPRFFYLVCSEFINAAKLGDTPRMDQAWADIKEILPLLKPRLRRRVKWVAPFINQLYRGRFMDISRLLLQRAIR
jgi:glycosyltransferase involved in cell wall biosynthesis